VKALVLILMLVGGCVPMLPVNTLGIVIPPGSVVTAPSGRKLIVVLPDGRPTEFASGRTPWGIVAVSPRLHRPKPKKDPGLMALRGGE